MGIKAVIIGNGSAARECYWTLRDVMEADSSISFKGFLAFEGFQGNLEELAEYELGSDDDYRQSSDEAFIIGNGNPSLRIKIYEKWKSRSARFMNLIHPTGILYKSLDLGEANVLTPLCCISCNVKLGEANYYNGPTVVLAHDVQLGRGNVLAPGVKLLGGVKVGSGNSFGADATVLPGGRVGDGNKIAPGAVLYKGCRNNKIMAGNPAISL